jgi:hypothetical protein
MPHPDLNDVTPRSPRAKIIFGLLIGIVILATAGAMVASVILYMKSA